jgi:hypothetical protein
MYVSVPGKVAESVEVGDNIHLICGGLLCSSGFNYELHFVFSKKDLEVRTSELLDAVSDPLLEAIANDAETWISKSSIGMVTLAVLKSGKG